MRTIIRKAYWDYENEEMWLNEMSAKGLALIDYTWCRYVFADCEPGEYIYRIELLEYLPSHALSRSYINFVEETGVEHISSYMRWVYFRRKASDGPFDIYSDIDSKIRHYRRILCLLAPIGLVNFSAGLNGAINFNRIIPMTFLSCLNFVVVCLLGVVCAKYIGKTRKLQKEKQLRE